MNEDNTQIHPPIYLSPDPFSKTGTLEKKRERERVAKMGPFGVGAFQFSGTIGRKVYGGTIDKSVSIARAYRIFSLHLLHRERMSEREMGGRFGPPYAVHVQGVGPINTLFV